MDLVILSSGQLAYGLTCNRPTYAANLQWNRVSNLEPSGPKAETLYLTVLELYISSKFSTNSVSALTDCRSVYSLLSCVTEGDYSKAQTAKWVNFSL
ncbi:hypothetical protein AVEN_200287-1 [Araneus ventricosus]|uniref:Uncharacterized protein n=1 Tax=Araneus ventricosus TaxID=182803 RepID=A0A4Y2HHZ2_ARAVE|nr:hypothetical protein AVEN_200287-1 [Araneus ventricosus]